MNIGRELVSALIVVVTYAALFVTVEASSRRWTIDVELTRKAAHFGAGMIALPFPWIFQSPWTIAALAVPFSTGLIIVRRTGMLRSVQGVARMSDGEVLYPISIATTLVVAAYLNSPYAYVCGMLLLAVSDGLAGIVGVYWGESKYRIGKATKSFEGSTAFCATATLCVFIVLYAFAHVAVSDAALAALACAFIGVVVEAALPNGYDNLGIPLVTVAVLVAVGGSV